MPVHVRQAVIAAEDRNFYSNPGFSFSGFARAVNNNLFGSGDLQGGSTITQQYVKNALVGSAQHGLSGLHAQGQGTRHRHQDVGGVVQR